MKCKNDEQTSIEHHMKKQINSARREVARRKREIKCEKTNKWFYDNYFVHRDLADHWASDIYKWTRKIDVNVFECQWDYESFFHSVIDHRQNKLQSKSRRQMIEI
jgi:hypothetical protein